jgi:alanine-synthesizing transaminase
VLIAPGSSFNVPYRNRFRITNLPDATTLRDVFGRIEDLLAAYASGQREAAQPGDARPTVVEARQRFK